jgi:hypothetical protein
LHHAKERGHILSECSIKHGVGEWIGGWIWQKQFTWLANVILFEQSVPLSLTAPLPFAHCLNAKLFLISSKLHAHFHLMSFVLDFSYV